MRVLTNRFYRIVILAVLGCLRLAAGGTAEVGEALHLEAGRLGVVLGVPVTNSMVATWLVALGIIAMTQCAVRHATLVPGRLQGVLEGILEGLLGFIGSIMGERMARKTFWLLATLFLFILTSNWLGLLPGFGSIGWGVDSPHGFAITRPLLRGADADLNMTFGMALLLMGCWLFWSIQEQGVGGFLRHIFGAKGDTKGFLGVVLGIVFFAAGLLEVISIGFRPISMSLRLFGNIFAGETMLEAMLHKFPGASWILPVPFYFVELLVGVIQAAVFTLLAAIFVMLSCEHGEESAGGHSATVGVRRDH
jgi:F-type H+-transporting ATPase subunit a